MAQNIYDDPQFFEEYSHFRRSRLGLAGAAEWPAMNSLLPPMNGGRVVDLGCGSGWFCRWAREAGAAKVLGLDLSEKMLRRARAETQDDAITYERADLDALVLPEGSFDLGLQLARTSLSGRPPALGRRGAWRACARRPLRLLPSNTQSTWPRASRIGSTLQMAGRFGPSTATCARGSARPTGSRQTSLNFTGQSGRRLMSLSMRVSQ